MHSRVALLSALAMLGTALAGCSGSDSAGSSDAITIENLGADGGPGPYRFTAKVTSEDGNYTWDLGDRLTVKYGESIEHTYDFANSAPDRSGKPGNVTVTLHTQQGGKDKADTVSFRIGTGMNASPAFALDAETNWAVTGQAIRFSAARSSDPDGDNLRYSWSCLVETPSDKLVRQGFHSHGNVGTPYASPPAGTVTSYLANGTLPAADVVYPGDLCDALAGGTKPSTEAATIQGSFSERGRYQIFLVASDGSHPTVSGSYLFYVTEPSAKPSEWTRAWFNQTLQAGADGALQETCAQIPTAPQSCDRFSGTFDLELGGLYGWVNVTYAPAGAVPGAVNNVTWELTRGGGALVASGGPANPDSRLLSPAQLTPGQYVLEATLEQGASVQVQMSVAVRLNLDPFAVY